MRKINKNVRILIVDDKNKPIGSKRRAKALRKGLNFRTVHVFAAANGAFQLQRLASSHQRSPGRLGASAAGFVLENETSFLAAARLLDKELGVRPYHLISLGTVQLAHNASTKFVEVFVASIGNQTVAANESEFSELLSMTPTEISDTIGKEPTKFADTFVEVYPLVAKSPDAALILGTGHDKDNRDCEALLDAYKVAVDEYRFQVDLSWNRNKFFLVSAMAAVSAAIAMTEFSSQKYAAILIPFLFLLSSLLAVLGLSAQKVGKQYYRQTHNDLLGVISMLNLENQRRNEGYVPIPSIRTTEGMRDRARRRIAKIDGKIRGGSFSGYLRWFFQLIAFVGLLGAGLSLYFGVLVPERDRDVTSAAEYETTPVYGISDLAKSSEITIEPEPLAANAERVVFEFVHSEYDEVFFAETANTATIKAVREELENPRDVRSLHINGALLRGGGSINAPWSWRFDSQSWQLAELSMEVCDAWPSYIEENLDTWMDEVGAFCPWAARVVREVEGL